jgi:hypothetical protein
MKTRIFGCLILVLAIFALTACGGGGGGGSSAGSSSSSSSSSSGSGITTPKVSFNLKDATAVLVYDGPIVVDNASAVEGRRQPQSAAVTSSAAGEPVNLVALSEDGMLQFAFHAPDSPDSAPDPVVDYTVPSPDNRYLYVVMGQHGAYVGGQVPLSSSVWDYCYLFKVDLETNEWACLPVVGFNNWYYSPGDKGFGQTVQFDDAGRTYIVGCVTPPPPENGSYISGNYASCDGSYYETDTFDVYLETEDGGLEALGVFQNDERITSARLTKNGDILYESYKENGGDAVKLWRRTENDGQVLIITNNTYDDHYIDDGNTIYYLAHTDYYDLPAPVFLRPSDDGRLSFDRLLLGGPVESPEYGYSGRLISTADGRLFVYTTYYFGEGAPEGDDGKQLWQLLPRRELISADVELDNAHLVDNLVIRISDKETGRHGKVDRLSLISLEDVSEQLLFDVTSNDIDADPELPFYDIYTLTLDERMAYFSALDLSRNVNVVGKLDLDAYNAIDSEEKIERINEYLEIADVGSASSASSILRDIKTLKTPVEGGGDDQAPIVQSIEFDADNPYSISVQFSKPMDHASVAEHLTLLRDDVVISPVSYMPLWLGNRLYLLVDQNDFEADPLDSGLPDTRPLLAEETYTIQINPAAVDTFGNMLANTVLEDLTASVTIMAP